MPVFRKATAGDLPAVMDIFRQAQAFIRTLGIDQWQDGYPEEAILRNDIASGQTWVYDDGTAPVSVAVLMFEEEPFYEDLNPSGSSSGAGWLTEQGYATFHRVAVNDAYRHSGLAADLLCNAEEISRAGGMHSLRVDTHRGNIPMRRFLIRNGYTLCGEVEYDISPGDRIRVAYEKLLQLL